MRGEIAAKPRRMGGTGAMQPDLRQQAPDRVRAVPGREEAFADVMQGIGMRRQKPEDGEAAYKLSFSALPAVNFTALLAGI